MSRRKVYDDDDGRTIVDMSQVEGLSTLSGWTSGAGRERRRSEQAEQGKNLPSEDAPVPKGERRMMVRAALKATLLIGLAYLAGLGLLVFLLTLIW